MSKRKVLEARFDASADIVSRLGAELFTDSSQALLELVKNCYDADATEVNLDIHRAHGEGEEGRLTLADNGDGMTEETIRSSWLRLSYSPKREQKRRKKKTRRNRTPLGDKGLGRLGAQLLGRTLEIRTRPRREKVEHIVRFDFQEFDPARSLGEVPVEWTMQADPSQADWPFRVRHGTVIVIGGLIAADTWADPDHLERELGRLLNPFGEIEAFALNACVDGQEIEVAGLSENVRSSALQRWHVTFDGANLTLRGQLRLPWFQARDKARNEILQAALQADRGKRLLEILQARLEVSDFAISSARSPWFATLERSIPVVELAEVPAAQPDCGPFEMELDVVARDFSIAQAASLSVFSAAADYRKWLDEQAGVRVYRDGFVVASGYDLLRLGEGFTKAASYYSLRPANVLGYVEITAAENPQLEETTDREGFRANAAFQRFDALLLLARDNINRVIDAAGRSGSDLARLLQQENDDLHTPGPESLAEEAGAVAVAATDAQKQLDVARRGLEDWEGAGRGSTAEDKRAIGQAREALASADAALEEAKRLGPAAEGVAGDFEELQENFEELYQTIGLGLAAEGVAHEITHVIQRLGERARLAHEEIDAGAEVSPNFAILVEEVDSAARSLRGQLKHLDPQLRRARTRRRAVALGDFVGELAAYHRDRLASSAIEVTFRKRRPAEVWLSPGRLAQVLDNLVLNSEYWVRRQIEENGGKGLIELEVSGSKVMVTDSGPGVPSEMIEAVFRPFVSMKARGRGLGLFIARQLSEVDAGALTVEQTPDGRNARFMVDLKGARKENLE